MVLCYDVSGCFTQLADVLVFSVALKCSPEFYSCRRNFERLHATPCRTPRAPQSTILQPPLTPQEKKKEIIASGYESNSVTLKIHDVEKFKRIGTILQHLELGNSSV